MTQDLNKVEELYPCAECGKPRTKDEGGTTFTLCDECWKKHYGKQPTEARQDELAGIREKIAKICTARYFECSYNDAEIAWSEATEESKEDMLNNANQILSLTVSRGGGVCPECCGQGEITGVDVGYPSIMSFAHCEHCNGTGEQPIVTKTIAQCIEEATKDE